ncbi:Translin [Xylaria bambusicola]|uniref:Translin n=1 Tax=Xylaria bambusicola TaxID=326684 RepID=UPI00200843E6|nr:Translin [Xylaria bambusicola]KAI0517104.1 Translin [Xylaria bambusicola]
MSEVIVPKRKHSDMGAGVKRDYQGREKAKKDVGADQPRNAYTSMFETFRDELDEHHDRRNRIGKVSRDVTALSKKIIFSLQRVRKLSQPIPQHIQSEIDGRLKEIAELLETIQPDVQGMNRHRYPLFCLEEFVEAVSFAHYLHHQTLMTPTAAQDALPADIELTAPDYVFGVFDLTGEMMRFATSVTALTGSMPTGETSRKSSSEARNEDEESVPKRSILADMQDVSSMLQICPTVGGKSGTYAKKLSIMIEQVRKVERLGYGLAVRGTERPKGWMPDLNEGYSGGGDGDDFGTAD